MKNPKFLFAEDSYGSKKRLSFISQLIHNYNIQTVVDIGCGTGRFLTYPLSRIYPSTSFWGYDRDTMSIENAVSSENIVYTSNDSCLPLKCDLLILSEVLEHIQYPEAFLNSVLKSTSPTYVFISVPNGFGPFEISSFLLKPLFHKFLKRSTHPQQTSHQAPSTFDISPHVNFFTHKQLYSLFRLSQLSGLHYSNRTFLCGLGFDYIIRIFSLQNVNAFVADYIPYFLVSDWMFFLSNDDVFKN